MTSDQRLFSVAPKGTDLSFGTAYYPDHWPQREWLDDLHRMEDAGISLVRVGEFSWGWYQPRPGAWEWGPLEAFLQTMEKTSLELCLCTPTATPPRWFDTRFPGGRMRNMLGQPCLSPRHFWSWHEEASRETAAETICALAEKFGHHPRLWGWQLDNEPCYAEEMHLDRPEGMYDFHPAARRHFIRWLQCRYGSLEQLNQAWFSQFWSNQVHQWEELIPIRGRGGPQEWLDFLRWREAFLAEFLVWQKELIRPLSPNRPIGSNLPHAGLALSVSIGQDHWAQANPLDWVATDLYEATGNRALDLRSHGYRTCLMASASRGKPFFIAETQGGPHWRAWPSGFAAEAWETEYLGQTARVYVRHGAKQIWFFLWRPTPAGIEMGMNGVTGLDGQPSSRTAYLRALDHEELVREKQIYESRPSVFLHYCRDSLRFRSFWPQGFQDLESDARGWQSILETLGFRVRWLDTADLLHQLSNPDARVVLPFSLLMADEVTETLAEAKARCIVGPHTACFDAHGHLRISTPAVPLIQSWKTVFGLWRDQVPLCFSGHEAIHQGLRLLSRDPVPDQVRQFTKEGLPALVASSSALLFLYHAGLAWEQSPALRPEIELLVSGYLGCAPKTDPSPPKV